MFGFNTSTGQEPIHEVKGNVSVGGKKNTPKHTPTPTKKILETEVIRYMFATFRSCQYWNNY